MGPRPGGDADDPNNARRAGEAKVLVNERAPEVSRSGIEIPGAWVVGDRVVKAVQSKVVAYSTADGKEKWSVSLPKRVCAAPPNATDDGKVVVAFEGGRDGECSRFAMLDLTAGKKVWERPIPKSGRFSGSYFGLDMALSGDVVGASWLGGSTMIKVGDGAPLTAPELASGCSVDGFAGGRALLRSWRCVSDRTSHVERIDTSTGKAAWTWEGREGLETKKIYSTDPAVVSLASEDDKTAVLVALKDGKERSAIDLGKQDDARPCGGLLLTGRGVGGCQGAVASDSTLYLATGYKPGSFQSNEVHAFDLDTGKRTWTSKSAGRVLVPLRMDGDKVIAYRKPTFDKPGAVVGIGSGGGDPEVVLRIPHATRSAETMFFGARYLYENGRFFIASTYLNGSDRSDNNKLLLAYGED
ncbi:PQQ-binding-like beta-propeller repeat protein [Streptomyces stramineus]